MRRRLEEEHDNKERWLVSYADFITLLFAFFVVMYSISSVNEGKYKVLSESFEGVFNVRQKTVSPIQVGDVTPRSESDQHGDKHIKPIFGIPEPQSKEMPKSDDQDLQLELIAGEFRESFEDLIFEDKVSVDVQEDWIEVSLDDTVVFQSGGVEPVDEAFPIIEKIAGIMRNHDNAMLVEGHTDNIPIRNSVFPSNWELSAARAASVVRYLALEGVRADRMGAMGYGEFKPVARNDTDRGRAKNRRVVLLISKSSDIRESLLN
ncbi:MAG: flagellar motor protein MotD [Oleiphilaceae bacterium]|nr:flagellar motor protein MotD [Oleiphilaceae bacterium]